MIPEGEVRLISSWTMPSTNGHPYYTVLFYCMITSIKKSFISKFISVLGRILRPIPQIVCFLGQIQPNKSVASLVHTNNVSILALTTIYICKFQRKACSVSENNNDLQFPSKIFFCDKISSISTERAVASFLLHLIEYISEQVSKLGNRKFVRIQYFKIFVEFVRSIWIVKGLTVCTVLL